MVNTGTGGKVSNVTVMKLSLTQPLTGLVTVRVYVPLSSIVGVIVIAPEIMLPPLVVQAYVINGSDPVPSRMRMFFQDDDR